MAWKQHIKNLARNHRRNINAILINIMKKIVVIFIAISLFMPFFPAGSSCENFVETIINLINEKTIESYLSALLSFAPRYTGSENCKKAEEWAYTEFLKMGLQPKFFEWEMGGFSDRNVIATLPGESNYTIILSAHIDTVENAPGADDDGSGVAAVLTIAKALRYYHFANTIKFVLYSGEEVGTYGSYNYARHLYEKGEKIIAVFMLDMVGYANTSKGGKYIRIFEPKRSEHLTQIITEVAEKYHGLINLCVEKVPNYPGSDHQAFVDYGYDAIFAAHYDGYPYGHSPDDTIDKINFTYEAKVAKLFAAVVAEMAKKPVEVYVEIKEPKEGYLYLFNHAIIPIISKTWYTGFRGITIVIGRVDVIASVDGEVEKVIFALDDRMWRWDYEPPHEWKINVMAFGKHYINVYAYGDKIVKDEMDIIAFIPYIP